jgi:hypothetical protein
VSSTDGRHDLLSDRSTFGNMSERSPGCKIKSQNTGTCGNKLTAYI